MAIRTVSQIQADLDAVNTAWTNALSGQSYSIAGRSKTNQSIEALSKLRRELQAELDRANGDAPMFAKVVVTGLH